MTGPLADLDARVARGEPAPLREPSGRHRLLGREIAFPIGVAASAATRTPRHIEFFAEWGFNVITAKTVRSREWAGHDGPAWIHLDDLDAPLEPSDATSDCRPVGHGSRATGAPERGGFSDANSFGVPSPAPAAWQRDLAEALGALASDQLLIASVQASPEVCDDERALVADFVEVAGLAAEAGATAVELNLSCPNVLDRRGGRVAPPLCASPSLVAATVEAVREALDGSVRLVAKLSYLTADGLASVLAPIVEHCDAVAGINTFPARILDYDGRPAFRGVDPNGEATVREVAGVSGVALRELARDFVRTVVQFRGNGDLEILAMGGVMGADDARALLDLGADAVQSVTAAAHDPRLARDVTRALAPRSAEMPADLHGASQSS